MSKAQSIVEMKDLNKETITDIRRKIVKNQQTKQQKTYEKNFNKWRDLDLLTCLIALVGLLLAIVDYEYTNSRVLAAYENSGISTKELAYDEVQLRLSLEESNFVRVVIMLISLVGIVTLIYRHYIKARWLNKDLPAEIS